MTTWGSWPSLSCVFRVLLTLLAVVTISLGDHFAASPNPASSVSWSDIRNAISETICFPATDASTGLDPSIGDRVACGPSSTDKALAEVVDAGIAEAMPLVAVIPGYEPSRVKDAQALSSIADRTLRDSRLKALFLSDPSFLDPVSSLVIKHLASQGVSCADCPMQRRPETRMVSLSDLGPYVLAFITVDPVISQDSNGHPISPPKYSYHVCSGMSGVATLPHDPALARAGFVAAMGMRHAVGEAVLNVIGTPEYQALQTDASRTERLRQRVHSTLAVSKELKTNICITTGRFGTETNLTVRGCPLSAHGR